MSFDNHPPKYLSMKEVYKYQRPQLEGNKRLISKLILGHHYTVYSTEEIKTIISLGEHPICGWLTRKGYKKHLEQKQRVRRYLEQEQLNKENKEQSL